MLGGGVCHRHTLGLPWLQKHSLDTADSPIALLRLNTTHRTGLIKQPHRHTTLRFAYEFVVKLELSYYTYKFEIYATPSLFSIRVQPIRVN